MAITSEFLTDQEAARLLRCSRAALVKFRAERRGPPFVRVGRLIRYDKVELFQWVTAQRVDAGQGRTGGV
jgi:excisionase family DNA binding protein